jgi:hypothetical protein
MKKIAYLLCSLCLVTFASKSAHADSLASYVGQTINMTVEPYASGENNGAFYVGLTQVNLATTTGKAIGSIEAFCDDFTHEISTPDTYKVVVTAVAGNTTMEQEAYYGTLLGSEPSKNSALDADIQELIWNYTAPWYEQYSLNSEMKTLQSQMLANYASANYSNDFYFNAGNGGQSFMAIDPSVSSTNPVPEPSTLITSASGLLAFAGMARRRFLRS